VRGGRRQQLGEPVPDDRVDRGPPVPSGPHGIVVGYGRVGSQLAALLRARGMQLAAIDDDAELVAKAHADGIAAIRGNAASEERMAELLPASATHALLAIPGAYEAGAIVKRLRAANPTMVILARAHNEAEVRHLLDSGADGAVLAERELAYSMAEMVLAGSQVPQA
jgi:CPA2 family monovalent cation:H+ antiporter-2